jgi:hypothetical protein
MTQPFVKFVSFVTGDPNGDSAIPIMAKGFYQRQMSGMVIGYEKESYS